MLRDGLKDTPLRVAKAWDFFTSGYDTDVAALLTTFEDGAERYDEMVAVVNIPFYSKCEHHLETFFGTATVAYIPDGRVVGLSKLNRLVDAYARRLQVQERITQQVANALMEHLKPLGAACKITARHMCMESRGVCQQGHHTVTTCLLGRFKEAAVRAEFLSLNS
jgi:GTP cyclohydrolase I